MAVSVFALRSPSASGSSWPEAMTNRRVARLRHGAQTRTAPPAPQTTVYPRYPPSRQPDDVPVAARTSDGGRRCNRAFVRGAPRAPVLP